MPVEGDQGGGFHPRADMVQPMVRTEEPCVTVITPARDMECYLRRTMRSVLTQSFRDFEYLVVDNGSLDATAHIVRSFAERDPRVRLLHEPVPGSCAARNRGLAAARGRYVAFVDADDEWLPGKLAAQVRSMESLPDRFAGVFCRSVVTSETGEELFTNAPPVGTYDLHAFLVWCNPAGNGSSFMVRRSVWAEVGGFDHRIPSAVEMEWLLRVLRDSSSPLLLGTSQELVRYRIRNGSLSSDADARMAALETIVSRFSTTDDPLVWLRPALMAYRAGSVHDARRWTGRARRYGWYRLVECRDGRRLLAHHALDLARRAPGSGHVAMPSDAAVAHRADQTVKPKAATRSG